MGHGLVLPKTSIGHQATNESFILELSLSMRPGLTTCNQRRNYYIATNRNKLYSQAQSLSHDIHAISNHFILFDYLPELLTKTRISINSHEHTNKTTHKTLVPKSPAAEEPPNLHCILQSTWSVRGRI